MYNDLSNCRTCPPDPYDRYCGEGDLVLRDSDNCICYLYVGTDLETWEQAKANPKYHIDVLRYDPVECIVR